MPKRQPNGVLHNGEGNPYASALLNPLKAKAADATANAEGPAAAPKVQLSAGAQALQMRRGHALSDRAAAEEQNPGQRGAEVDKTFVDADAAFNALMSSP